MLSFNAKGEELGAATPQPGSLDRGLHDFAKILSSKILVGKIMKNAEPPWNFHPAQVT